MDEHFLNSASLNQKYLGFLLFERILDQFIASSKGLDEIPLFFTKNFARTLFNHLHSKDNYLNKCAEHLVSMIVSFGHRISYISS